MSLLVLASLGAFPSAALADGSSGVTITAAPSNSEPAPAAGTPAPAPSPTPRTTVAWFSAGIALAAAATAGVFGGLALHEKSSYEAGPTYANTDKGDNDAAYADGAIALAVAAGVTSIVLFATREPTSAGPAPAPTSSLSAAPFLTAHGGGAGAVLHF